MAGRFQDRREAGRMLAGAVAKLGLADPVVLALPRGGVPVAYEVARALHARLDVLLVRKLGAPFQKEFGIGAIAEGTDPIVLLDDQLVRAVAPPPGYVEEEIAREMTEMARRRARYAAARQPLKVAGRTVVLVDDGIATGGTARVALLALRRRGAARVVLAVPVAASASVAALRGDADEIVCVLAPERMNAVGNYYVDFSPTPDQEVVDLLSEARPSSV